MKPDNRFIALPKSFWADVRLIGQEVGYTVRHKRIVKVPSSDEIKAAYKKLSLRSDHLFSKDGKLNAATSCRPISNIDLTYSIRTSNRHL